MRSPFSLAERVALVTGASRGLGLEIARAMARAGAHVLVNSRSPERMADFAAQITAEGLSAEPLPFDVADREASGLAFDRIEQRFGRLDIFVFNVALRMRLPLDRISTEEFQHMLTVDLTSAYTLGKRAGALMTKAGWGRIIFITSIAGELANRNDAAYIAAKAGLTGLMRAFAFEFGSDGVTCNAIAPGAFETESNLDIPPERLERVRKRTPVGRRGHTHEIAGPAVFLASDEASYINGHVLTVDGGYSIALEGERPAG